MAFLDFAALKEATSIDQAIDWLGLKMRKVNQQFRGSCPVCKGSGPRSLVITPSKQAFYCFAERIGGDVIALVAHIKSCDMKEAAEFLAREGSSPTSDQSTVPKESIKKDARSLQPLSYLEVDHAKIKHLGLSPTTCKFFGAGYAAKGIMRGKFAYPVHSLAGELIAYGGIQLDATSAEMSFPKDFDPELQLFNHQRQQDDEVILSRSPFEVMQLHENGIENAISFLTTNISARQFEALVSFLEDNEGISIVIP